MKIRSRCKFSTLEPIRGNRSIRTRKCGVLVLALVGVVACAEVTHFEDVGSVRVVGKPVAADETGDSEAEASTEEVAMFDFAADEPLRVEVTLGYSTNGCARDFDGNCEVEVADHTIRISAAGSFGTPHRPGKLCPSVALPVEATCNTPPLPAGTYVVTYGSYENVQLVVPSRGEALWFGEDWI